MVINSAKFSFQLDEATDVTSLSRSAVFLRYVREDVIKEDLVFCKPLTTTKAAYVKNLCTNSSEALIFHEMWCLQFVWKEL